MRIRSLNFTFTPFHAWVIGLGAVTLVGLGAGILVFTRGLVITNLTDLVPWGLWITIDLSAIALSAGAFLLCAAVYILGLKKYQRVARTATFIGLIGYSMALLTLLLDIGRPDRFWHALVFWNTHSVLWEVTMCIVLYFTVLFLETMPIFGRAEWMQQRWPWLSKQLVKMHHYAPFLAIIGLGLSMLHQSSLGAAYGVLKARPLWFRPGLSVLFIVSAMAGGPALTVLASMLSARFSSRVKIDDKILERISYFVGWVLIGYLYFRLWDALSMTYNYLPGRTEGLDILTRGSLSFNFWVGEIFLGILIPIFILFNNRRRQNPVLRMVALALVVGGIIAYRWDTNLSGLLVVLTYLPNEIVTRYTEYVPSLVEILSGLGVITYGLLAFTLGVRYLNIVDHRKEAESEESAQLIASAAD